MLSPTSAYRALPAFALVIVLLTGCASVHGQRTINATLSTNELVVLVGERESLSISLSGTLKNAHQLTFLPQHAGLIDILPSPIVDLLPGSQSDVLLQLEGLHPGHLEVTAVVSPINGELNIEPLFMRITVAISSAIIVVSEVVGWIYFVAWSVSFYPQAWVNYRRKSVVGLHFDFLALNLVGFVMYSIFNLGLYWDPVLQAEYFERNPRGLIPVQPNDIFFAVHALVLTLITIGQCFWYERGDQRVSWIARGILAVYALLVVVFVILASTDTIHWLDFLYYCSYIKLSITLIKYIPQAVMNYRRKSTVGWSIGNILLDFTGGILSMLQMILNAYNYDDWASIFGDLTKFGLGLFSVLFDILFIVQHYGLYRNAKSVPADVESVEPNEIEEVKIEKTTAADSNDTVKVA